MKRIDADGSVGGLFTDGNPGMGVPATVVDAEWLNDVQQEICTVIEGTGATLDGTIYTQLQTAILAMITAGALAAIANFTVANNISSAANVTGLVFDKTKVYGARILYHLHRESSLGELNGIGEIYVWYCPILVGWKIAWNEYNDSDDHGVIFTVTSAGQIQYTSSNLGGTGYAGTMRIGNVSPIKI